MLLFKPCFKYIYWVSFIIVQYIRPEKNTHHTCLLTRVAQIAVQINKSVHFSDYYLYPAETSLNLQLLHQLPGLAGAHGAVHWGVSFHPSHKHSNIGALLIQAACIRAPENDPVPFRLRKLLSEQILWHTVHHSARLIYSCFILSLPWVQLFTMKGMTFQLQRCYIKNTVYCIIWSVSIHVLLLKTVPCLFPVGQ